MCIRDRYMGELVQLLETWYFLLKVRTNGAHDKAYDFFYLLLPSTILSLDALIDAQLHNQVFDYIKHVSELLSYAIRLRSNERFIAYLREKRDRVVKLLIQKEEAKKAKPQAVPQEGQGQSAVVLGKNIMNMFGSALGKIINKTDNMINSAIVQKPREGGPQERPKPVSQTVQKTESAPYYDNNLKRWVVNGQVLGGEEEEEEKAKAALQANNEPPAPPPQLPKGANPFSTGLPAAPVTADAGAGAPGKRNLKQNRYVSNI
eukprot:TRINITY_DN9060_c0_g2_i6.p1 TRINITY_DN9060_c0_g2~~TRINITY_DN9060_c0_g2_i6.p1  ORF type:complete len:261 (-),score=84.69 TRINITY_DN9060_c0_g2_i6:117-899(-)